MKIETNSRGISAAARRGLLVLISAGALGGCSFYQAKPLSPAAVETALQAPPVESVKVAAAKFDHPLLKPLEIDGRDGYTPDEIALMTVIVSPQLRALRDQRGVARAQVVQAGILPNPQLSYSFDKQVDNSEAGLVNAKSLGLSWEVTSLLTHHDNVVAAKSTAEALDLSIAWQEWQAAQDARLRAFRVISLEARLPLARETEKDLSEALALNRQALSRGQQTLSGLTVASEAWSAAQDARFALEQQVTADRAALNVALGQPADSPLRLKPGAGFPVLPATAASADALLQGLERRRLDLVALTLGYESQDATLRAAIKAQFPKISLSLSRANDTSDIKTRGVGVTVDLPVFDRNQGQIAIGKATREQLFDEYVARVAEARSEVFQILSNLAIARTQLQTIEQELPELEELSISLDRAVQSRNVDVQTWRDARGALLARQIEHSKMQQDVLELSVALEIATGRPLLNRPAQN